MPAKQGACCLDPAEELEGQGHPWAPGKRDSDLRLLALLLIKDMLGCPHGERPSAVRKPRPSRGYCRLPVPLPCSGMVRCLGHGSTLIGQGGGHLWPTFSTWHPWAVLLSLDMCSGKRTTSPPNPRQQSHSLSATVGRKKPELQKAPQALGYVASTPQGTFIRDPLRTLSCGLTFGSICVMAAPPTRCPHCLLATRCFGGCGGGMRGHGGRDQESG